MRLQLIIVFNLLLCSVLCDDNEKRKLSVKLNPECESQIGSQCDGLTFIHIEAESADNSIHYLWDFTGVPSFFIAKTDKNVQLRINWDDFMHGLANSVNFSSQPAFLFSAVIKRILLFDDEHDKADINDPDSVKNVVAFDPRTFTWQMDNLTRSEDRAVIMMKSFVNGTNGTFALKVRNHFPL
jgi:hypothetical protein